jgi:hypothetical protein
MDTYAANTVRAASEASAAGGNCESGAGSGGGAADGPQQYPSVTLGIGTRAPRGTAAPGTGAIRLHRRGADCATLALIVAVLALAVAVSR